jgi:hypothetical protein
MPSLPYKISSKSTNRFKTCTHLRCLQVRHFGIVEDTTLISTELRSSSMSLPLYKISSKSTNRFKTYLGVLCTHLRGLNFRHFGMAEAMRLKMWHRGHLQWYHLPIEFHKNPLIGTNVITGGGRQTQTHADRLAGWRFDKPTFIFGK